MKIFVRDSKFYKNLFFLAVPMMLQNLISISVGIADNIMVGSLGELAISGVAMANQVQNIIHMLMVGISSSIILLSSQYWGKGDTKSIKNIISIGFKVCLPFGVLLGFTVFFFPETVLGIFTNEEAVIAEGSKYLKIMAMSYVFFCITNAFIASMRCVETVHISLLLSISTLIVDVSLNYILIFGKFGSPAFGIRGAAMATLAARIIECGIMVIYIRFIDKKLKIRFSELLETNSLLAKDFFKYGFPVMIGDFLWGIGGVAQASVIGRMGAAAIAANSMTMILFSFVTVMVFSLGGATSVIIGKTVGAEEYEKVKQYARTLQAIYICTGIITSILLFNLRDVFLSLYNVSGETKRIAKQFMTILCVTVLGTAYHAPCFTGIIRAGGDTRFVLKVDTFCIWVIVMPLSCLMAFVFHMPPAVVFLCLKIDQCFKWIIAIFKVRSFSWIKNLTR